MKAMHVLIGLVFLLPLGAGAEEEAEVREAIPRELLEIREQLAEREAPEPRREARPLDKVVFLDFQLTPGNDELMSVSTATSHFTLRAMNEERDEGYQVLVEGHIEPTAKGGYRILFECVVEIRSLTSETNFNATGSTIAKPNQAVELARTGKQALNLTLREGK